MVKHLESMDDFNTMLETSKTKLVVVDFTATWCGPCKYIGPIFEKLAEENPDIEFVKVDVDEADDVAAHCGVRAMPTFQFFRNGEKIEEMMGADQNKLAALVAKLK
ncbi:thioredoxin h [Phaeodactylum tricornutum CCAP 1055/1]|jgi:thioredoxin|uniref:Thioredoxin n=2 Tax=Phaeodactylum tricornutum TaxID=2850 RepID=B7G0C9_PHATC|nr:thioredoxin h [Phaeodactylum tricornutum CCAP 1055/1]EEC48068.1 thioredoxin h [Phaeodactylum tricornutum CCAP 1055/1]|eukprot:XP_002180660.1 thioredoxin h [Phaeodactylum tricornutum CCAP 1055/1]